MFKNRNFVIHWLTMAFAQIGGFFTLVAIPWLVLILTNNDAMIMASVMATISLPHSIVILFGGVLADRFSPLVILKVSRILSLFFMFSLAGLVLQDLITINLIYLFALIIGSLSAVAVPASQSILPNILAAKHLGNGNGVMIATTHVAQILGPVCAGWLIYFARISMGIEGESSKAVAVAFILDSLLIIVALFGLQFLKINASNSHIKDAFWPLLKSGFQYCWQDIGIRTVLSYLLFISFFLHGPLMVFLPLITKAELGLSEASYGNLYAMIGTGVVLGAIIMFIKPIADKHLGLLVLFADLLAGVSFCGIFLTNNIYLIALALLVIGICSGLVTISGTSWFQKRTSAEFLGRVMSILLFVVFGSIPLSATLTGLLINQFSINQIIIFFGLTIISITSVSLFIPAIRNMGNLDQDTTTFDKEISYEK